MKLGEIKLYGKANENLAESLRKRSIDYYNIIEAIFDRIKLTNS